MSASSAVPVDRIRVFNREGLPLAEFRASVSRSWAIGEEGRAAFDYPTRKTDVVNDDVLRFGNWLLVENSMLPAWVGVIDIPREWHTRSVTICAYTPEHVFGWRRGPLEELVTGSPGTVFTKLLQKVNQAEATILRAGLISRSGKQLEETINPTQLNEDLHRIWERSGEEYQWRPVIDASGRLVVYADWMPKLGVNTQAILQEGKGGGNLEAVNNVMVEDGPILNDLLAYGDGESWQSKPTTQLRSAASIARYGLRQSAEEYTGVSNTETLKTNGKKKLNEFLETIKVYQLHALNVGDTFKYVALGNRLALRLQNAGFGRETTIRILGMAYDPDQKNKLELVVEDAND